jgi:hypothetical protein
LNRPELDGLEDTVRVALRAYRARSAEAWHRHLVDIHQRAEARRHSQAADLATLRFKYAPAVSRLALAHPQWVLTRAAAELPPGPIFGWTDEQTREAAFWMKLVEGIHDIGRLRPIVDSPGILNMPNTIKVGHPFTIMGIGFALPAGTVTLRDCAGMDHELEIRNWSGDAIEVEVSGDTVGIPYDCQSSITIKRSDGKTTTHGVVLEPLERFWINTSAAISAAGWGGYSEEHTFESAIVPSEYHKHVFPSDTRVTHADGVSFVGTYDVITDYNDSPVSIAITEGPAEVASRLRVVARVTDDFHVDFSISAEFFIDVPLGFPVAAEWRQPGAS